MLALRDRSNFDILSQAFQHGHVALMEVQRVSDSSTVAAICAVEYDGQDHLFTPFAILLEGNPFRDFNPPHPDGGFVQQEDAP